MAGRAAGVRVPEWTRAERAGLAGLLLVAALLLFARFDDRFLWQDEAETALLAESVLVHGVPTAWDGRNRISQEGGQESSPPDHRWFWTPWLQHYATALSFALLGPSTASARLPFVLFGLGTIGLVFLLARDLSRDRRTAFLAAGILAAHVPFLLHVRQCRYYAPAALFGVLLVWQYARARAGRRGAAVGLAVAAVGLFHSHYVVCAGFLTGLALHWALFDRRAAWLRGLVGPGLAAAALTLPWLVGFVRQGRGQALPGIERSLASLHEALFHVDRFVFPLLLLALAGGVAIARRRAASAVSPEATGEPAHDSTDAWALACVGLATIALLVAVMPWFFFRYYVPLIPLAAVGQALLVAWIARSRTAVFVALSVLLVATDVAGRLLPIDQRIPARSVRHLRTGDERSAEVVGAWARFLPLAAYLHEIATERTGPIEVAVAYLREHADPDDRIVVTYGDLPIQFYTGLRVLGGLSGQDPAPFVDAEWLFVRAHTHRRGDARLKRWIRERVDAARYERIPLGVPDLPYENRPDPTYHKFRTPAEGVPEARLWRRRGDAPDPSPNESPAD